MPPIPPQIDPEFSRSETDAPQRGGDWSGDSDRSPVDEQQIPSHSATLRANDRKKSNGREGSGDDRNVLPDAFETSAGTERGPAEAPLTFVPHEAEGGAIAAPARIRTNRYGELEEHELVRLLDTIEDERARGRFRESIYISLFIWMAIVWVLFYGPKYLWHAPQLITPTEALQQQEVVRLNAPVLPHHAAPAPKLSRETIAKIRSMEPKHLPRPVAPVQPAPTPPPVAVKPVPPQPSPALPLPAAPKPMPRAAAPVPEAPLPQAPTKPNFGTQGSASQEMQQAMRGSEHAGSGASGGISGGGGRSAGLGAGYDILSDTQGVNFEPYIGRILREIYEQWLPLIPEEAQPPLNKQGTTLIRFTINPDGTIAAMHLDGSTHDDALNRAAWGSITGVGQFPPLPKEFHGPNLELRIHYLYNPPRSTE